MSKQTFTTSNSMALEQPRGALGKVSTVFATKLKSFTFLPLLKKLPKESTLISGWEKGSSKKKAVDDPKVSEECIKDEAVYKADIIYVTESNDAENQKRRETSQTQLKFVGDSAPLPTPAMAHVEICCPSPVTMEPIDKQSCISHNTFDRAELSPGLLINHVSQREEEVLSPASSVDLFPSIASSRESILYEGWEQDRSWSALQMLSPGCSPVSFSRTVSPCSSVRSGAFTPSVLRIKRHTLAPGSSLVQMPLSSGQTICCDSQAPSPCPLSPRARHRPPPARLSLLTAILRKGRLPILSPAMQRPYSPCWPISPVSISSCKACSAACNIMPVENTKTSDTKGVTFTEPSQKARPVPPRLNNNTLSMSSNENKASTPSVPLGSSDSTSSEFVVPPPKFSNSLPLPSPLPSEAALGHQSEPGCKEKHVPTLPSSVNCSFFSTSRAMSPKANHVSSIVSSSSPPKVPCVHFAPSTTEHREQSHSILDSSQQRCGHKSKDASLMLENAEPSLDLKHQNTPSDPSPIPDHKPAPLSKHIFASTILKEVNDTPHFRLLNGRNALLDLERVLSASPALKQSPSPKRIGLTRLSDTLDISSASPRPSSRSPTPDRYTLSPSPAIPSLQLSPSPSYSLCSSPSPSLRDGSPDSVDTGGKSSKSYKIKSTYKTLAAIPTNKLLLEQQAIDDEVENNESSLDPSINFAWEDPHSQMCTPAQLRQQSAELYAAIDEVLEDTNSHDSNPSNKHVSSAASQTSRKSASSPLPKSLGRETKYAHFHHQGPEPAERTLTKPGVIRPFTATRPDNVKGEEYVLNPFQGYQDTRSNAHKLKFASSVSSTVDEVDRRGALGRETHEEMISSEDPRPSAPSPLLISQILTTDRAPQLTSGPLQGVPSSLKPVQVKRETPEAPI